MDELDSRPGSAEAVARQWRTLILDHPLVYLRVRASAFGWVLLTPRPSECVMVETGVDGPAEELAQSGLSERDSGRDQALAHYAFSFAGTPVSSHAAYAAIAIALVAILLRRRAAADIATAAMLGGAIAFAASFAVISIACDYRYLYDLDVSTIAALLYVAASSREGAASTLPKG